MPAQAKLQSRYELKEILGQGGMGVVYKAYDVVVKRDVAVKTLRGIPGRNALQLFQKECEVLASLSHPNIVEIFDVGEFEEQGERKPFLVMPLLPGMALDKLIYNSGHRLTVERSVEIITQACRGLHAAHERGLVHRDLKPSNIFVMRDDSVKIIDFGVALMVDSRTTRGLKGTLLYMAPEQIEMKPLSALSDIFSLGAVCYETFTQRRPFERPTEAEIADAILHQFPPPASELNPRVSQSLTRVIHKAMAKQPWHRFANAREFAETLGKALRNEPIELFEPSRIQPRIQRAHKAFEQADYQFSAEILSELEAEGHRDAEISELRQQIDQGIRQKTIRQLLESARTRLEEDEYPLALQKIQEVLQLDPENANALGLKSTIENKRTEGKIEGWFRLAHQHLSNQAYTHARQALQNVLEIRPSESRALQLLAEVDRREQEYVRLRQEKEQTYKAAQEAWQNGEISDALSRMGVVLELERRSPETTSLERTATYQNFYNQVRSEHDALNNAHAEARTHLADRDFTKALALCNTYLAKYPGNALLQALKFDVEEQQRQERSAYIADVDRRVEAEHDLVKRVGILEEVLLRYPGEAHFERSLHLMREKRDRANSIVAKARSYEERNQFGEALSQWEILRTIYQQFPGLDFEIERVIKRRDQQNRIDSKARWIKQIEQPLQWGDYARATELSRQAQAEFPNDPELANLEKQAHEGMERAERVRALLAQGQELGAQHRSEEGIEVLRQAYELDPRHALVRAALSDALSQRARDVLESDWRSAEILIEQALEIDPGHDLAKSLRTLAADRKRQEFVDRLLSQVRQLQSARELERARSEVEKGLTSYPHDPRLSERLASLTQELAEGQVQQARLRDLEELRTLNRDSGATGDLASVRALSVRAQTIAKRYPDDPEFQFLATRVGRRLATLTPPQPQEYAPGEVPLPQASGPAVAPAAKPSVSAPGPKNVPPRKVTPAPTPVTAHLPADQARKREGIPRWQILAGAVVILVAGASAAVWFLVRPQTLAPRPTVGVTLTTSPPGAKILIDGKALGISPLRLTLREGSHQLEAQKDGYQGVSQTLAAKHGSTNLIELKLEPLPMVLWVSADFDEGTVRLDGVDKGSLRAGGDVVLNVDPGPHKLTLVSPKGEVAIAFEAKAANLPALSGGIAMHKTLKGTVVVVTGWGNQARIESNVSSLEVRLGDKGAQQVGSGLDWDLSESRELAWGVGKEERKSVFETGQSPTLSVFVDMGRKASTPQIAGTKVRPPRITPPPLSPSKPEANPSHEAEVARLNSLGYQAFLKTNYASPKEASAISYFQRALKVDPNNDYAKGLIEDSVRAGTSEARQALQDKNVDFARRMASDLEQLLPGRADVAQLEKEVASAARANQSAPLNPEVSFQVRHLHGKKARSGSEAYCEGTLSVTGQHLEFVGESSNQDQSHTVDYPSCSNVEIKKNTHFAGIGQPGFHVRKGSRNDNFESQLDSAYVVSALNKACKK